MKNFVKLSRAEMKNVLGGVEFPPSCGGPACSGSCTAHSGDCKGHTGTCDWNGKGDCTCGVICIPSS